MIGFSDPRSTVVAIASATSPSLRGIVRIAGDEAVNILKRMAEFANELPPRPSLVDVELRLGGLMDTIAAKALVWPTSSAYTGCPSVEIHTFGSMPIMEAIVQAAIAAGARPAGPGEFTMRAFLAGRLDLTQAEAVLGVIDATSKDQLDAALVQLAGNVSAPLRQARGQLIDLLADVEAGLDFVEEDITFIDQETLLRGLEVAFEMVRSTALKLNTRRRNESFHWIVLRGEPNAGKSSLLNSLLNEDVALVSDQAGTTRDVVWKETSLAGYRLRIADTAGIESSDDEIMKQSQLAAGNIQKSASIVLRCIEAAKIDSPVPACADSTLNVIHVATKVDTVNPLKRYRLQYEGWINTSAVKRVGIESLQLAIANRLAAAPDANDVGVPGTAARCIDSIARAMKSLGDAMDLAKQGAGQELIASEIRQTLTAIGEVTGEVYTDDILDRVFSRFCIGK